MTSELIVNVDNPDEAAAWLAQQRARGDFITLLFSNNVHEIRGYNRGAGAASGRVVIFLQDDDVPEVAPRAHIIHCSPRHRLACD
jgi:hypothetical protein